MFLPPIGLMAYRPAPATGGTDLDLSYADSSSITPQDLLANWTLNGNTMTFVSVSPSLPAGLSISTSCVLSGTPTTPTADDLYTLTAVDAYGREVSDTFTLEVTSSTTPGTITIDTLTYARGTAGVAPDLTVAVSTTGSTTANYTLFWATRSTGTAMSKTAIENGTGDALDNGSVTASTLDGLDASLDLSTTLSSGAIDVFVRDSTGTAIESAVASVTGVTYDATPPGFSSAEVGNAGSTTIVVTLDKATYGSTSASDWTVLVNSSPVTESGATLSSTTTVDVSLGSGVANGDTVTIAYSGSGLVGVDGEVMATFTAQAVTNNVPSGGGSTEFAVVGLTAFDTNVTTVTFSGVSIGSADASREVIVIPLAYDAGNETLTAIKETDAAGSSFTALTGATYDSTLAGRCGLGAYSLGVASGTTMDIYLQFSGNISRLALLVLRKVGGSVQDVSIDSDAAAGGVSVSPTVAVGDKLFALTLMRTGGTPSLSGMDGTPTDYAADIAIEGQYVLDTVGTATTRTVSDSTTQDAKLITINVR